MAYEKKVYEMKVYRRELPNINTSPYELVIFSGNLFNWQLALFSTATIFTTQEKNTTFVLLPKTLVLHHFP